MTNDRGNDVLHSRGGNRPFERELQIIVFTLLVNLGFFKLDEIPAFVDGVSQMVSGGSVLSVLLFGGAFILYLLYVGGIAYGLFCWLQRRGSVERAIFVALGSFFFYYILVLIYNLNIQQVPTS